MTIKAKFPISSGDGKGGKIIVPKDTKGFIKAISNSPTIKAAFPNLEYKINGWFYIVSFPGFFEEILCTKDQIEIT
jgi:hypothetical protein